MQQQVPYLEETFQSQSLQSGSSCTTSQYVLFEQNTSSGLLMAYAFWHAHPCQCHASRSIPAGHGRMTYPQLVTNGGLPGL